MKIDQAMFKSDTQITCTLGLDPEAGSHTVQLRDENGLIPVDPAVTPIATTLSTTNVSGPRPELNQLGGDSLTFEGTGYQASGTD